MATNRPGAEPKHYTITIHYKPEDGSGFLIHSVKVTKTQYSINSAEQICWNISGNGFMMEKENYSIWIPSHRVISVRLDRKE